MKEVSSSMMSRGVCLMLLLAWTFTCRSPAQSATFQAQPTPPQPSSQRHTVALVVPDGTPLQIALDKEVRVRKVGEPITGRVMQPLY
ncbi:MAG TPA: hypothetical protein VHZ55_24315, partial [Bryobacteraceae bacterium]|nr:hypothetical protein [Bryobacteraceae bacterium]